MRLYELTAELAALDAVIDEACGELTPETEAALDALQMELGAKVDGIAAMMRQARADSDAADAEAALFKTRALQADRKYRRLSEYLMRCLGTAGLRSFDGRRFKVRVQRNSMPTIRWARENDPIPQEFQRIKVELDGPAARQALARGTLPEGFTVEYGEHVRIS